MRGIQRILVVVDSRKEQQRALARAAQICRAAGNTSLHILAPNPKASQESMAQLEMLAKPLLDEGLDVYLHETWNGSIIDTIIHVRQVERCHLVVKDIKLMTKLQKALGTAEDWSLLRRSRVPILLVQTDKDWHSGTMLAAINADPRDYYHSILNQAILSYACEFAKTFTTDLHVVSAHPTIMQAIQDHGDGIVDKDHYQHHCKEYAVEYKLNEDNFHVRPGPTESLIPAMIEEFDSSLLILGTHARKGINALAIGNTAELLITRVKSDILILQPKHHMIPLERELGH